MSKGLGLSLTLMPFTLAALGVAHRSGNAVIPVSSREGIGFSYAVVPLTTDRPPVPNAYRRGHDPHRNNGRGRPRKGFDPNSI